MLDIEDFDAVFSDGVTYSDGIVQQIQEYQHALGGRTFFERLLDLLKIKGTSTRSLGANDADIHLQVRESTHPRTSSSFTTCTSASSPPKRHFTTNTV
jgi:hypothetical protein